jgi:hypothetical protein
MPFIGVQPATVPLTSSDITDGIISTAKIADDAVTGAKIENTPSIANGLTLTDGNLTLASGHGIDFSATADTSASGASMASELFDDYEEGTWTPSWSSSYNISGTVTSLTGQYTKIGRTVYLQARTVGNAGLNISSFAVLEGIPFAPTNDSDVGVYVIGTISSRSHGWTTIVDGNAWYFSTASSPSSATNIDASIVYRTTA